MIELQLDYGTFLTLKVSHNYFANNSTTDFKLVSTKSTDEIFRKVGFMCKSNDEGLFLLYDKARTESFVWYLENFDLPKFSFWLHASNTYFHNFTNLPAEDRTTIFYFDNQKVETSENATLHENDFVSSANAFKIKPAYFEMSFAKNAKIALMDENKNIFIQETIEGQIFNFDMRGFQEGKYTITENGKDKETFVYLQNMMPPRPVGLIELKMSEKGRKEILGQIKEEEPLTTRNYKVCFETRSTYWRYLIVPKYQNSLQNLVIDTGETKVPFKGPKTQKLPNGVEAYCFESEKPLALQEITNYNFQLVKNKDSKGKSIHQILRRLPVPSFEMIKPESRNPDSKIYSEIIIYI